MPPAVNAVRSPPRPGVRNLLREEAITAAERRECSKADAECEGAAAAEKWDGLVDVITGGSPCNTCVTGG